MPVFSPSLEEDWINYLQKITDIIYGDFDVEINSLSPETVRLLGLLSLLKQTTKSKEELLNLIRVECPSNQSKMTALLRDFTENLNNECARVFCLTTEYDNDVMWAHYSDNHSGCVLGFRHIEELYTPFMAAKPVSYTIGNPIVGRGLDFLLYGHNTELRSKTVDAICYSKDEKWSYEEEWRVVAWRPNEHGQKFADYEFYDRELASVTFGPRIVSNTQVEITKILSEKYPSCEIYKMVNEKGNSVRIRCDDAVKEEEIS